MPDYSYTLYDSLNFGATANAENILFQTVQGGDSTHTETFTNMRGPGQLPTNEAFTVSKVALIVDKVMAKADVINMFMTSIFQLIVANLTILKVPSQMVVAYSAYGGSILEATIADTMSIGLLGNGYSLDLPVKIKGGTPFQVRVLSGQAVTASSLIKAALIGTLTMEGSIS